MVSVDLCRHPAPDENPTDAIADETPEPVTPQAPRLELRDPLPPVVDTPELLRDTCERIAAGTGPIALDAERASGYRYSQRAYLVQVRREGSGTHLIDPIAFDSLVPLDTAFDGNEWILHAATQDLMCLAEVGLYPESLFDTELAGRLLNLPRVGLAALVEHYLGLSLAKEFSAADWSTRPLPEPWLVYAALDVEVLVELRDLIDADLQKAGKRDWAAEEFEALLSFQGPPERKEPWRRTSGIHKARGRRALGLVREIWEARDAIAEARDTTPGRILPDTSILEIAVNPPQDANALKSMRIMKNRGPRRFLSEWYDAVERGPDPRRVRAADDRSTYGRTAAPARMGRQEPRGRRPARSQPRGHRRARREARSADREPHQPPGRPQPRLGAAHADHGRHRHRGVDGRRRARLADRADHRSADGGPQA